MNAKASSAIGPPWIDCWRKASVRLRPRRCRSCFRDRCSQLVSACLPNMVRVAGLAPWWPCASTLLLPRRWPRANARLLLTLHPEIGCQSWTRTNTERLNRPPCYFDTTWQSLIGAAGRTCTCISSFRKRMPHRFRPRQHLEMVSAAGIAPAFPRSQAECVGCYATRCLPRRFVRKPPGSCFLWRGRTPFLETGSRTRLADPKGVAPSAFPRTTGCSALELRIRK